MNIWIFWRLNCPIRISLKKRCRQYLSLSVPQDFLRFLRFWDKKFLLFSMYRCKQCPLAYTDHLAAPRCGKRQSINNNMCVENRDNKTTLTSYVQTNSYRVHILMNNKCVTFACENVGVCAPDSLFLLTSYLSSRLNLILTNFFKWPMVKAAGHSK